MKVPKDADDGCWYEDMCRLEDEGMDACMCEDRCCLRVRQWTEDGWYSRPREFDGEPSLKDQDGSRGGEIERSSKEDR